MLFPLPPEIQELIFSYCKKGDLKNLNCVSYDFKDDAVLLGILWERVRISLKDCLGKVILNDRVKHCLSFVETFEVSGLMESTRQMTSEQCELLRRKISTNLTKALLQCDPGKLRCLSMNFIPVPVDADNVFRRLHRLENFVFDGSDSSLDDKRITHMNDQGMAQVCTIPSLKKLEIKAFWICTVGFVTGKGLTHMSSLVNLQHLDLTKCTQFTDEALCHISNLKCLQVLKVNCCQVTRDGFCHLQGLPNLRKLSIVGDDMMRKEVDFLPEIGKLTSLTYLLLNKLQLEDRHMFYLLNLKFLQELDIRWCLSLTCKCLKYIGKMNSLHKLMLSSSLIIENEALVHVESLSQLKVLDISFCGHLLTNDCVRSLTKLKLLKKIIYTPTGSLTAEGFSLLGGSVEQVEAGYVLEQVAGYAGEQAIWL